MIRLALFLLCAALVCGCATEDAPGGGPSAGGRGGRAGGAAPVPVDTGTVVQKSMPVEIRVIGAAEPQATVSVRAQITGQLLKVHFSEGDEVKQGQLLFTLDRRP